MRTCIIGRKTKKEVRHEEHLSPDCAALAEAAVPIIIPKKGGKRRNAG
ncbi:hypothetical protein [[Eubacterium] hominis]